MKTVISFMGYDIVVSKIVAVSPVCETYPAKFSIMLDGGFSIECEFQAGQIPAHDEARQARAVFIDLLGV